MVRERTVQVDPQKWAAGAGDGGTNGGHWQAARAADRLRLLGRQVVEASGPACDPVSAVTGSTLLNHFGCAAGRWWRCHGRQGASPGGGR